MKKLFLILAVTGFAFASCGKKASCNKAEECPEKVVELIECEDGLIVDDEVIEFEGECEDKAAE